MKYLKIKNILMGLCVLALLCPLNMNAQRKRAFMVGISTYRTATMKAWNNIHGADDILLLKPVLQKQGFNVIALTNADATYANILKGLTNLMKTTQRGDIVYIHFSCHGQPVEDGLRDNVKDEEDGWDEALVPVDAGIRYNSSYHGEKHFLDDQLNYFVEKIRARIGTNGFLYVVLDACHSGKSARDFTTDDVRGTNEGLSKNGTVYNPPISNIRHYKVKNGKGWANVLFLEACKSFQRNTEVQISGKNYGALSYNVYEALKSHQLELDDKKFENDIRASIQIPGRWHNSQTLVTESSYR